MIHSTFERRRPGFTLVELLVVIAIIAVLAALTLTGAFRARDSQDKTNTSLNMKKIDSILSQQTKAIVDQAAESYNAKATQAVQETLRLADNDTRRGKALWIKMQLRLALPQSLTELTQMPSITYTPPDAVKTQSVTSSLRTPSVFGPLAAGSSTHTFTEEATRLNTAIDDPTLSSSNPWTGDDVGSAVILYLTVTAARRGIASDIEQSVGSSALGTVTSDQKKQFKVFIDAYGSPIKLVRVVPHFNPGPNNKPPMNPIQTELDGSKFSGSGNNSNNVKSIDPTDREGTLIGWTPGAASGTSALNWNNVQLYLYGAAYSPHNFQPFIASAGPDKAFGTDDDILSFRLREAGQRGD